MRTPKSVSSKSLAVGEDTFVWALIASVGVLGIAVGVLEKGRMVEPALGVLMVLFVIGTVASERVRAPRR